jgi:hypothetical protein
MVSETWQVIMKDETRSSLRTKFMGLVIVDVVVLFSITFLLSYAQLTWNNFFSKLFIVGICAFMITAFVGIGTPIRKRINSFGDELSPAVELKEPPIWILVSSASAIGSVVTLLLSIIIPVIFAG